MRSGDAAAAREPSANPPDRAARALGWAPWLGWGLLSVVLAVLGMLLPVYWVYLLATVAVSALVARSIGLVTGQLGIITLCQMSFAAIGGWVVSALALVWPAAPFPLLVLVGGCAAAPAGLAIGLASARIRGVEFAIVSLGFAAALDLVVRQRGFPGVGAGTTVIPSAPFDDPRGFFALAWGLLILLQFVISRVARTRFGLAWSVVRSSERTAAALGVRAAAVKTGAFGIGAAVAGLAGGLLAGQYGLLTTSVFTPLTSMVHLATAVLCGASLFAGAVLAGVFAVFVPELLRRFGVPLDVGNALLAIGAFDVLRRGNGGLVEQLHAKLQERAFARARLNVRLSDSGPGGPEDGPAASLSATATATATRGADPGAGRRVASDPAPPVRLEISELSADYGGEPALDRVSLRLARGEVHALVGPNGAGKSTLVDAVTGFLPGYRGAVTLAGEPIDGLSARERARRGVRRTFQHIRSIEGTTVGSYLRLAAGADRDPEAGLPADDTRVERMRSRGERIRFASDFLGLPPGRVPIRLLDAGSRRVLEIAGALVSGPGALLLDEPAAGLGEEESAGLAERVRRIPAAFGCSVLLIEHDMGFVRSAASTATVLDAGRVITTGPVAAALGDPRVVASYLGRGGAA
ncbi:branched-chain amino acid ABC transporter ATP-binding protein/permease [Leucobacter sp.]